MIAKFSTTASDKLPPEMLRTVIVQLPEPWLDTQQLYAPDVAPDATLTNRTSRALSVHFEVT